MLDADEPDAVLAVRQAEDRRYAAMLAADEAGLASLLAEDLLYVHTTGDLDTKVTYLDAVRTGLVRYRHLERSEERFAVHGGTVLSTGRQVGLSIFQGKPRLVDSSYLAVWVADSTRHWQLAGWHATVYAPTR